MLLPLILFASTALASFDSWFEYQGVSLHEKNIPTYFMQFDSEYSSHILNYSLSLEQNIRFENEDKIFIHHQGSISSNEFLKHSQLKIDHALNEKLRIKLLRLEQKNFEAQQEHSLIEFSYVFPNSKLSALIDLEFQKREDNLGFNYTYYLTPNHYIKTFLGLPYYDWNNRNREDDTLTQTPYIYGLVGRYQHKTEFYHRYFEYGYRKITPLTWRTDVDDWKYKKNSLLLRYYYNERSKYAFEISQQIDSSEQDVLNSDRFDLRRNQSLVKYQDLNFDPRWNYDLGLYTTLRRHKNTIDTNHYSDFIPFVIFHDLVPRSFGYLSYGYDYTLHDSRGSSTRDRSEHRFNLHIKFPFQTSYLKLLLTFDLDDLSKRPWEGGHGSFEMQF